jgi:type IV pilus assembly protein PilX
MKIPKKKKLFLKNQSGAALVIALIMLVVLTVIGIASTLNSTYENQLAGNKRGSTDCFYTAESGIQAPTANIANFNSSTYTLVTNTGGIPQDLRTESIDSQLTSPSLNLSPGVSFQNPPTVTIYHTTVTGAPRGSKFSAVGNYNFAYFIIDSVGCDQLDVPLLSFNCEQKEKIVRLLPTETGGT